MTKVLNDIQDTRYEIRNRFVELAVEYVRLKVPFRHRGISRNGCDCTGLIISIARELGYLNDYKLRQYGQQWNLHKKTAGSFVTDELEKYCKLIPKSQASDGDIITMQFGRCVSHCGILITKNIFVHQWKANIVCKKSVLKNSIWSVRWVGTYRIEEAKLV